MLRVWTQLIKGKQTKNGIDIKLKKTAHGGYRRIVIWLYSSQFVSDLCTLNSSETLQGPRNCHHLLCFLFANCSIQCTATHLTSYKYTSDIWPHYTNKMISIGRSSNTRRSGPTHNICDTCWNNYWDSWYNSVVTAAATHVIRMMGATKD
jgi:hypothetical protein